MAWSDALKGDSLSWLLERDAENPGVRLFALQELVGLPPDDAEVVDAQAEVMRSGPVPVMLDAQDPAGFWVEAGPGYYPKYTGTLHTMYMMAQLGADGSDPRIRAAAEYLFAKSMAPYGGYSATGRDTGLIHCLQGNMCAAMTRYGYLGDQRHDAALEWLARSITGEGIALESDRDTAEVHYFKSANCAPGFCCSANNQLPCAWGAVKAMVGLASVPEEARTPLMKRAIETGIEFLLGKDPAVADYPMGYTTKPSGSWFRFGYPIGYVTDVLQTLEALTALGCGGDPRLDNAVDLVLGKQDAAGRWPMEYGYNGKLWADVEAKKKPSKWVTLRALRVIERVHEAKE